MHPSIQGNHMSVTPPSSATQSRTDAPIGIGERVAYGVGDMATGLLQVTVAAFLTFYYTDTLLLSAAVVGTIIATMRIVDAFVDLAVGTLVDRTRTRWGKARPFLLGLPSPMESRACYCSPSRMSARHGSTSTSPQLTSS